MIKNIVLDMGNVLLNYDPNVCLQAYVEDEKDRDLIRKELFQGPEWAQGDLGVITNVERYDGVSRRVPERLHTALRNCVDHWMMCMKPLPGAKAFCDGLKEKGYHLYLLSNADFTIYDYFPDFVPFSYFDGKLVSADVHIVKPDVRIYQLLMETYGLNPEECLFVDDRMDNVEGAKKAGMQGVQFLGDYKKVENFLKEAE